MRITRFLSMLLFHWSINLVPINCAIKQAKNILSDRLSHGLVSSRRNRDGIFQKLPLVFFPLYNSFTNKTVKPSQPVILSWSCSLYLGRYLFFVFFSYCLHMLNATEFQALFFTCNNTKIQKHPPTKKTKKELEGKIN